MNAVEIRQRKKIVIPFILMFVVVVLISGYFVFFMERYQGETSMKITFVVGLVMGGYLLYPTVRDLSKDQLVMVLTDDLIILKGNVVISKGDIENIEVTQDVDSGYFLEVKSKGTVHKINVTWLDKAPVEIKELIKKYR